MEARPSLLEAIETRPVRSDVEELRGLIGPENSGAAECCVGGIAFSRSTSTWYRSAGPNPSHPGADWVEVLK